MLTRPLGSSGIEASAVGLGTWAIGGWMWGGTEEADAVAAIQAAIDRGVSLIDTAPVYGFGRSEQLVGQALAGRRDRVVLATKCGLVWDTDRGDFYFKSTPQTVTANGEIAVRRYLGPESIRRELDASLQRLGTDHVDLYQTHWQETTTPIVETMGALLELKQAGKIRAIGVSNASSAQMEEYRAVGPLDSDQEQYSMLDRDLEAEQLPYLRDNGIALLAYSPLALGLLSGTITPDRKFGPGDQRSRNKRFTVDNRRKVAAMLKEFGPIAERHGVTTAQLVIAWTLAQPGCTHVLVGARTPQHATENAAAAHVELSPQDLAAMNETIARHAADIP